MITCIVTFKKNSCYSSLISNIWYTFNYEFKTNFNTNKTTRSIPPDPPSWKGRILINSTQLNEHLWTQVLKHLNVHIYLVTIAYRYYNQLVSRTDLSPIPVRSAAKSYITSWCIQNLSKRVLNRQTVSTSTT